MADNKLIIILLCIFLPPVAVVIKKGLGVEFIISIVLTLLGGLPGMIYALWVCLK